MLELDLDSPLLVESVGELRRGLLESGSSFPSSLGTDGEVDETLLLGERDDLYDCDVKGSSSELFLASCAFFCAANLSYSGKLLNMLLPSGEYRPLQDDDGGIFIVSVRGFMATSAHGFMSPLLVPSEPSGDTALGD